MSITLANELTHFSSFFFVEFVVNLQFLTNNTGVSVPCENTSHRTPGIEFDNAKILQIQKLIAQSKTNFQL